jgi:hypothetical protein
MRSLTTQSSFTPASSRTFCSRWISLVLSSVSAVRYRVRSRSRRMPGGGTKLGLTSPCATSSAIYSESVTSVLRPGTFLRCPIHPIHPRVIGSRGSVRSDAWTTIGNYARSAGAIARLGSPLHEMKTRIFPPDS